jgi:hypothetical protein
VFDIGNNLRLSIVTHFRFGEPITTTMRVLGLGPRIRVRTPKGPTPRLERLDSLADLPCGSNSPS